MGFNFVTVLLLVFASSSAFAKLADQDWVDSRCEEGDGAGGTEERLSGTVKTVAECVKLVAETRPTANGATTSNPPQSCYAEYGMDQSNGSPAWTTCRIEPTCIQGDGVGGTEEKLPFEVGSDVECMAMVKKLRPSANGATVSRFPPRSCWAEFDMEESNGSSSYTTCKIEPACIPGDGVGEERNFQRLLASEVESEADCIALVKELRPSANGATMSADLPGPCYAEFFMAESNGSPEWKTCRIEPACLLGDGTGKSEEELPLQVATTVECIELVKELRPTANGAKVPAELPGPCYAEFAMETTDGNTDWRTCRVEPACVEGNSIGGTEEELEGIVRTVAECIARVKETRPAANAATVSTVLPGSCFAKFGMVDTDGSPDWQTCGIEPSCIQGDGIGGTEEKLDGVVKSETECIELVRETRPTANGATVSAELPGSCYAEFNMTESNGSSSWRTCPFEARQGWNI